MTDYLKKEELLSINGGSEESYDLGYRIGRFVGDALGAFKRIKEALLFD